MKLSTAIRLGAMLSPQGFYQLRDEAGRTCALGAAEEAIGGMWILQWPMHPALQTETKCPECVSRHIHVRMDRHWVNTVAHLNDSHKWTRERIADWVEQFESQVSRVLSPGEEEKQEKEEEYARVDVRS